MPWGDDVSDQGAGSAFVSGAQNIMGAGPIAGGAGGAAGAAYGTYESKRDRGNSILDSLKDAWSAGKEAYEPSRKEVYEKNEAAASKHPIAYAAGNLSSGLLTSPLLPEASAAATGAGLGATEGAVNTISSGNYDPKDIAKNTGKGAAAGYAMGKVGGLIGDKLSDLAGRKAYKSLGPYGANMRGQDLEDVAAKGQSLLKNDIVGGIPTSYEGLAERAQDTLEKKGPEFEKMLNNISENSGVKISKEGLANKLADELRPNPDIPVARDRSGVIQDMIDQVKSGPDEMSMRQAQKLKTDIGQTLEKRGVWNSQKMGHELNPENQFLVSYYHALNKTVEQGADITAGALGNDIGNQWKQLKFDYGTAKEAASIASKRAGKEFVNRSISPSDYAMVGAGVLKSGVPTGILLGAANQVGRKYGNQLIASGANKASEAVGLLKQPAVIEAGTNYLMQNKNNNKKAPMPWEN